MKMSTAQLLLSILGALSLTACGGGGSESPAPQQTQVAPPTASTSDSSEDDSEEDEGEEDEGEEETPEPEPELETVWTFAIHEDPIVTVVGDEYGSFVGDYHVEDFDGDGLNDMMIGGPVWDNESEGSDGWSGRATKMEVLWGTEEGFVNDTERLFGSNYEANMIQLVDIVADDFNGDDYTDFVFTGSGLDTLQGAGEPLDYYQSTGNFTLADASEQLNFDTSAFMHSSTKGDFNGDGFMDVSSWQCCFIENVELQDTSGIVLMNDGTGEFERDAEFVPAEFNPVHVQEALARGSWQILESFALDLNGTGCDDMIVGGGKTGESQILWNHCNGRLSTPVVTGDEQTETFVMPDIEGFNIVLDVVVYSVNDDGLPDLLVSRTNDNYELTYLQVLRNNGDNTFTDVTNETVTQSPQSAAAGKAVVHDFDNDGYDDVVFRHAMYKGTADGLVPVEFERNYIYNTLVVIDANNDGKLDVLLRHVVPETFGWNDQTVEYTLLENVSE